MKSLGLYCEDAQDKDDWRLRIKGVSSYPWLAWKMSYIKTVYLCICLFCCLQNAGLNKWVEIGNSGVFRPEMLLPMGLPPDVSVIAWGLSLER